MAHLAVGEGRHGVPREELGGERREKYCAYSTRPLARLPAGSRREAEAAGYSNASSVVFILPVPQRGRAQQVRWTHTGPSARPGTASSMVSYRPRSAAGHSKFGGLIPRGVDYRLSAYESLDGDDGTGDSE